MSTTRYARTIALVEGATTEGEAVAAAQAILRIEARDAACRVDDAPYFMQSYPADHTPDVADVATLAYCLTLDNAPPCAAVVLAYFASPATIAAAMDALPEMPAAQWNLCERARTLRAEYARAA